LDYIGNRTLKNLWNEVVSRTPNKTFLIFEDQYGNDTHYTYQEFNKQVNCVANGLMNSGIGYKDKVAIHLNNSPEFLLIWFACAKIGAIIVPSNIHLVENEIEYLLSFSDSKMIITEEEFLPRFEKVLPKVPTVEQLVLARTKNERKEYFLFDSWLTTGSSIEPVVDINQDDILEIIFTSGTTARPKGVMLTHGNHLTSGQRVSKHIRLTPNDRSLTALPLFHVNAQSISVLSTLTVGGTVVLVEKFSATKFLDQMISYKVTRTSVVPMILRKLLAQPESIKDKKHQLESIFFAINVLDSEKEEFEQRFGVELLIGYGLSEAMTLVTITPMDGNRKWPSIGLPTYDREVKIVDGDGNEVPQGEVGEIIVRGLPGKTIMAGYYKNEKTTNETIKDGWLYTGDNGYMDEEGYIYFFDRKKDMIKQAGENISATEVERTIMTHPKVQEVAIIGVRDPIRDEVVKAFIITKPNQKINQDELKRWCEQNMAKFKVPHYFEFLDEFPRTSIGKVEKKLLRKQEEDAYNKKESLN
jgi:crotonobetaine/carnitine-CoA ligase